MTGENERKGPWETPWGKAWAKNYNDLKLDARVALISGYDSRVVSVQTAAGVVAALAAAIVAIGQHTTSWVDRGLMIAIEVAVLAVMAVTLYALLLGRRGTAFSATRKPGVITRAEVVPQAEDALTKIEFLDYGTWIFALEMVLFGALVLAIAFGW